MDVAGRRQEVTLRDGTRVVLRPIRPADKAILRDGVRELSPRSRYLRFHTAVRELTDDQLRYLTEIDYRDHMAWLAENPDDPEHPGMGVARYIRLADEPTVAEAAVTVLDRYQGQGLGTALLRVLGASALENGIRTFRNYVLAENEAMLDILDHFGGIRSDEGDGVYRIDVPLGDLAEEPPGEAPVGVLRAIAEGRLPSLRWVFPWSATLKRRE